MHDFTGAVVNAPKARVMYSPKFLYDNPYRAVVHGVPSDLLIRAPSKYIGGEATLDEVIENMQKGMLFYEVVSAEEFAERRQCAIEQGRYDPAAVKAQKAPRVDKGGLHVQRLRKQWGKIPPLSTEVVGKEHEEFAETAIKYLEAGADINGSAPILRDMQLERALKRKAERNARAKYVVRPKATRRPNGCRR